MAAQAAESECWVFHWLTLGWTRARRGVWDSGLENLLIETWDDGKEVGEKGFISQSTHLPSLVAINPHLRFDRFMVSLVILYNIQTYHPTLTSTWRRAQCNPVHLLGHWNNPPPSESDNRSSKGSPILDEEVACGAQELRTYKTRSRGAGRPGGAGAGRGRN